MWKTTNYKGETVTWYSEEEYNKLKKKEFKNERNDINDYSDSDAYLRESDKQGE